MPRPLDIVGLAEAATMLGYTRPSVTRSVRNGTLPAPEVRLACGPIWRRSTIQNVIDRKMLDEMRREAAD